MLFPTLHLASEIIWFSQIWITFFSSHFFSFWFREWNSSLHHPIPDSKHMSGLYSNEPCSPTSGNCPLATMASLSTPNGGRCSGVLWMSSALPRFKLVTSFATTVLAALAARNLVISVAQAMFGRPNPLKTVMLGWVRDGMRKKQGD